MKKFNILLVDDDETSTFLSEMVLKDMDIAQQITIVNKSKEALEFVLHHCRDNDKDEKCPQLIFLDINMPVMNGFEFLEALKRQKKDTLPVIMLTSSNDLTDLEKAREFNLKGFINKPLTEEKLISVL